MESSQKHLGKFWLISWLKITWGIFWSSFWSSFGPNSNVVFYSVFWNWTKTGPKYAPSYSEPVNEPKPTKIFLKSLQDLPNSFPVLHSWEKNLIFNFFNFEVIWTIMVHFFTIFGPLWTKTKITLKLTRRFCFFLFFWWGRRVTWFF